MVQVYLLVFKALMLIKSEFDSTFLILQRTFLLSFIKVRLSRQMWISICIKFMRLYHISTQDLT